MDVKGTIFDCDGTLLNSMRMWDWIFVELLAREGHPHQEELVFGAESMNVHEECDYLSEALGASFTGDDLYRKLKALLPQAYAERVTPFPGAKAFVESLAERGIPMVIATSTEAEDVSRALVTHGLRDYFEAIVSSSDLGIGKTRPYVYERALEALGTPKDQTPVFEDAPFACETAAKAGFAVVGFVRGDGDHRDIEDFRPWCAQIVSSFDQIDLAALPSGRR